MYGSSEDIHNLLQMLCLAAVVKVCGGLLEIPGPREGVDIKLYRCSNVKELMALI